MVARKHYLLVALVASFQWNAWTAEDERVWQGRGPLAWHKLLSGPTTLNEKGRVL
jgi:hypothetical protein